MGRCRRGLCQQKGKEGSGKVTTRSITRSKAWKQVQLLISLLEKELLDRVVGADWYPPKICPPGSSECNLIAIRAFEDKVKVRSLR